MEMLNGLLMIAVALIALAIFLFFCGGVDYLIKRFVGFVKEQRKWQKVNRHHRRQVAKAISRQRNVVGHIMNYLKVYQPDLKLRKNGDHFSIATPNFSVGANLQILAIESKDRKTNLFFHIGSDSEVEECIKHAQVVAIGTEAHSMLGRTPEHITAIKPLVDGVISAFETTEEMLNYLLARATAGSTKLFAPRVVVGVPSGITNVEIRAVRDATRNAGAGEVHIVEEPMAAAIGMRMPVNEPIGNMVIDIGGGTSDIAVISMGGVVRAKNLRVAGDKFNSD